MHWTEPATADDSPDCGDMSPLSRRDMSRAKSSVMPAHSAQPTTSRFSHLLSLLKSYHILDPACGSGGMFIQSARFAKRHLVNVRRQ